MKPISFKRGKHSGLGWAALAMLGWVWAASSFGGVQGQEARPRAVATRSWPQAHAHNDYEHARPLLDALEQGFGSVEADIHRVGEALLVGHDAQNLTPERTLQRLYLDPLLARTRLRGGKIHHDATPFYLLIDLKTDGPSTYARLDQVLQGYGEMLTRFAGERVTTNAVTVIVSGNRPRAQMEAQASRWAAMDGRAADLETQPAVALVPWISDNWKLHFAWRGTGPMTDTEQASLRRWVERTHAQGRKLRFWGAPDDRVAWALLADAGVDFINTDQLAGLRAYLEERGRPVKRTE